MSDWSTKQLAMELLARGTVFSPDQAIATALRFQKLWEPEEAEKNAFSGTIEARIRSGSYPAQGTEDQQSAWNRETLRLAKEAGSRAFNAVKDGQT